jgi:galactoside O-acetyltransferase
MDCGMHETETQSNNVAFAFVGANVKISPRASFYGASRIRIADNVRIDDFCVLSAGEGGISIGRNVHIGAYSSLIGRGQINLGDFCNISSRVSVYSSNDDYSGTLMTNPTVPPEFSGVTHADVHLGRHVIVGCGSVILPGVKLDDGVAIGALSFVTSDCSAFGIYAGVPARFLKNRKRDLMDIEQRYIAESPPQCKV